MLGCWVGNHPSRPRYRRAVRPGVLKFRRPTVPDVPGLHAMYGSCTMDFPIDLVLWFVHDRWEVMRDGQVVLDVMLSPTSWQRTPVRVAGEAWILDLSLMNLRRARPGLDGTDAPRDIMVAGTPAWDDVLPDLRRVAYYVRDSPYMMRVSTEDAVALDLARACGHRFVRLRLRSPGLLCVICFRDVVDRILLDWDTVTPRRAELIMVPSPQSPQSRLSTAAPSRPLVTVRGGPRRR